MTRLLFLLCLAFSSLPCTAEENATAKAAFQSVAPGLSADMARRIVEITGKEGATQPSVWRFVAADATARDGIRVIEVRQGQVIRSDTPVGAYAGGGKIPVMDLKTLPIDSKAAFLAVNAEATRAGVGFEAVDYALRLDAFSGRPTWVLTLLGRELQPVGTIFVSAVSGRVVRVENLQRPVERPPVAASTISTDRAFERSSGFFAKVSDGLERTGGFFEKGARTAGGTLQEFFTGRRTVDRKYR